MESDAYSRLVLKLQRNKMNTFQQIDISKQFKHKKNVRNARVAPVNHTQIAPLISKDQKKLAKTVPKVVPQELIEAHKDCFHGKPSIITPEAMQDHLIQYHEARYVGHGIYVYELPSDWRLTACKIAIGMIVAGLIMMLGMVVFSTTSYFKFEDIYKAWDNKFP